MRSIRYVLFVGLILARTIDAQPATDSAVAVEPAPETKKVLDIDKAEDSRLLFEEREVLSEQLSALDQKIADLSAAVASLPPLATLEKNVATVTRDLERAKNANPQDPARIDLINGYLEDAQKDLATFKDSGPELIRSRLTRESTARRLFRVEQRIAALFDSARDTNRFRTSVTYTFGVLVFFVIVGFYMIAWAKEGIAKTIFAGEMGMQFVTLFLIVIAIILFGIMGTLEGKELSALLGGLSGYILGRSSQPKAAQASGSAGGEATDKDAAATP